MKVKIITDYYWTMDNLCHWLDTHSNIKIIEVNTLRKSENKALVTVIVYKEEPKLVHRTRVFLRDALVSDVGEVDLGFLNTWFDNNEEIKYNLNVSTSIIDANKNSIRYKVEVNYDTIKQEKMMGS